MRNTVDGLVVKPFVKWAGGKTQILDPIRLKYPAGLGQSITKYAEPFVGGGAVLFDLLRHYHFEQVYISDINRELICAYQTIRDDVETLVARLSEIERRYLPAKERVRKELYYLNRDRFNSLKAANDTSVELTALFLFLNRTCFNGLYRVNSKGAFNVPQGRYKNPGICDADNLRAVAGVLQNVRIVCGDFRAADPFIDQNTFVYFDPPYRPLTGSSSFTAYARDGFSDHEQIALAQFINRLSERGAYVVASNSDPKNADQADNFFDDLYARQKVFRVSASRAINAKGNKRGKINELLIASN